MDKRELARMLRRTNTADLLDDGIENGSDLKSSAKAEDDAADDVDDVDDVSKVPRRGEMPTQSSPLRDLHKKETPEALPPREPVSFLGLFFGACFLVFGVLMFLYPQDVSVYHDRIRSRPFLEHVTATGSQAYAAIALVIGIALCWFSLYRPKR